MLHLVLVFSHCFDDSVFTFKYIYIDYIVWCMFILHPIREQFLVATMRNKILQSKDNDSEDLNAPKVSPITTVLQIGYIR